MNFDIYLLIKWNGNVIADNIEKVLKRGNFHSKVFHPKSFRRNSHFNTSYFKITHDRSLTLLLPSYHHYCNKIYDSLNNRQLDFVRYGFLLIAVSIRHKERIQTMKIHQFPRDNFPLFYISLTCVTCFFAIKLLDMLYITNSILNLKQKIIQSGRFQSKH